MKISTTDGSEYYFVDNCLYCGLTTGGQHEISCPNYEPPDSAGNQAFYPEILERRSKMLEDLINQIIEEEERGRKKWGSVDRTPVILMIAIQEEIGEVAHAINKNEGAAAIKQEISEVMGLLSRLYEMV